VADPWASAITLACVELDADAHWSTAGQETLLWFHNDTPAAAQDRSWLLQTMVSSTAAGISASIPTRMTARDSDELIGGCV
jgi:hypothetical protein